jgi:hypothetical protein
MKKIIAALWLLTAPLLAQSTSDYAQKISNFAVRIDGGAPTTTSGVSTDTIWTAKGDLACGLGLASAGILGVGSNTFVLTADSTQTCGFKWAAPGGSTPTGTGFVHVTGGVQDGAANTTVVQTTGVNTNYPGLTFDPTTTKVIWDDFDAYFGVSGGPQVSSGMCGYLGTGTSSGSIQPTSALFPADGNHPGVFALTTGTTTTGMGMVTCGGNVKATNVDSLVLHGNEIFEWAIYVPAASGATNTFRVTSGLCDAVTNAACSDELGIYWDNNADTHWGCETASGGTPTSVISTTVATAAAWHKLRIEVNSNATSIAYKVDGSTLSCSPLTTNIPTGITHGTGMTARIVATAGCAATTTCTVGYDYAYGYIPGISR